MHKKIIKCLKFSVSKDETRPRLRGVYHSSDLRALISTNGHCLTYSESLYSEELKDVIIDANDYTAINKDYPTIKEVIPTKPSSDYSFVIEKHHCTKSKSVQLIYFNDNNTITFEKKDNTLFAINGGLLKPIADGGVYSVRFFGKLEPVLFNLNDNFKDFYLISPFSL